MTTENKLHPLLIVAATSVTVASLAAVASFTGLLPGKSAPTSELTANTPAAAPAPVVNAPVAAPSVAAPVVAESKPATQLAPVPKVHKVAEPVRHSSTTPPKQPSYAAPGGSNLPPPPPPTTMVKTPVTPPICRECGTIELIREVKAQGEGSGLGAVAGGLLGGLLGNQMGRGSGRDVATVVAAAGGAYAGHQVEKSAHAERHVEITVRFDDDSIRTFNQQEASRWRQGDRIRMSNGQLLPI